jgi:DNA processing protein
MLLSHFILTDMEKNNNIQQMNFKDKRFPQLLRDISNPPKELFIVGAIPTLPMVAVVGTRRPTDYGKQMTYRIAYDLAKAGFCIVSGLALGIDAVAHQAAVEAGGKTLAVLGNGLSNIYPITNRGLAIQILKHGGGIISEFDLEMPALKQNFPARNRIIAGLGLATIVTEADAKSGSLITANFALVENRMVMAVPGNTTSLRSAGPNNLIKNGAKLITDAADVLAELGLQSGVLETKPVKADSREEAQILEILSAESLSTQQLIEKTEIEAAQLASILSLMEITGKIRNLGAGTWISC